MKKPILLILLACVTYGLWLLIRNKTKYAPNHLQQQLAAQPINHLGIIMDGNRRWAKRHGFKPWIGHKEGVKSIKTTIEFCIEFGIKQLTLYTLSLENLKRPHEELSYLFDVLAQELASKELDELFKNGIHVRFIGDRSQFPAQLVPIIQDIEQKTASNNKLYLNLLFCYGGQQELVAAAQKLCAQCADNSIDPQTLSKQAFFDALWSAQLPPIDLIIRTAGDQRLSNYLPVQSAYADLYFIPAYWPDLTKDHLLEAVRFFLKSKRTFGV